MVERLLLRDKVSELLSCEVGALRLCQCLHSLAVANVGEEVGNLVGVHAWGRHFDGTRPVEVVVAKGEGQVLQFKLGQRGLVQGHEEVGRSHAALRAVDRDQEEVKLGV